MSIRMSLLALSALGLSACDGVPLRTAERQAACCCDHCPTTAAPAPAPRKAETPHRPPAARVYRVHSPPRPARESRYSGYSRSEEGRYEDRYAGRGRAYVGVSAQESETSSERYSYSQSSSGYAYGGAVAAGGYGYGYSGAGPCCVGHPAPYPYPRYHGASTGPDGYLTWPGKVED